MDMNVLSLIRAGLPPGLNASALLSSLQQTRSLSLRWEVIVFIQIFQEALFREAGVDPGAGSSTRRLYVIS